VEEKYSQTCVEAHFKNRYLKKLQTNGEDGNGPNTTQIEAFVAEELRVMRHTN
jgi:hypothetical protein